MNKYLPGLLLFVLMHSVVHAESPDFEKTRIDFERMAEQLPYLAFGSVLYDHPDHSFRVADPSQKEKHFELLKNATDQRYSKQVLLRLLSHAAPKVRTLAAVALFDREDPSVLPELVRLSHDETATFDGHGELLQSPFLTAGSGPPEQKQTVGGIARDMVRFYMERAGFYYGIKHSYEPGFDEYWKTHKDRSHCAGWFTVQLARACHGTSPTQPSSVENIQALRKRIDQLPADDRAWILLWLNGETGSDALVTDAELLDACQRLGADKLLLMLQHKIPTDDPDLQPRKNNNWPYQRMTLFVLNHASQLLRPEDSEKLLACESTVLDYKTPWWAIAAATLNPDNASQILHECRSRFLGKWDYDGRCTLCVAMWSLLGARETDYILDWFYSEAPEPESFSNVRSSFVRDMEKEQNGRRMIYLLIKDPRFAQMGWTSLHNMVSVVNKWLGKPVVTQEELREAMHPFGMGSYDTQQIEARAKYPKETADLLEHLNVWRERLRACSPQLIDKE